MYDALTYSQGIDMTGVVDREAKLIESMRVFFGDLDGLATVRFLEDAYEVRILFRIPEERKG